MYAVALADIVPVPVIIHLYLVYTELVFVNMELCTATLVSDTVSPVAT